MSYVCEIPEFYYETFPKAAKAHRCCECRAPIEIGERHLYARGKSEGYFWRERQHMLCRDLCMLMNGSSRSSDECFAFGDLKEEWNESEWGRPEHKHHPETAEARSLYARVLKRERAARRLGRAA